MIGQITYSYQPEFWDQQVFLSSGGYTVVFLNYNKGDFLSRSVPAALNQDFALCEMFFMDDASRDGSGDEMERIVREYRGRHKVTVVRNTENQRITGQWNIVAKLATGNWLGMFCADDMAYPDRVTKIDRLIRQHPTVRGVCTFTTEYDITTGRYKRNRIDRFPVQLQPGCMEPEAILRESLTCGATAFWHRTLFEKPLPPAPLDDEILHWRCFYQHKDQRDPMWLYETQTDTVEYTVGSGITAGGCDSVSDDDAPVARYLKAARKIRHYDGILAQTYAAMAEDCEDRCYRELFRLLCLRRSVGHLGTLGRLVRIPQLLFLLATCRHVSVGFRVLTLKEYIKTTTFQFLGLHIAAFVSTSVLHGRSQT